MKSINVADLSLRT